MEAISSSNAKPVNQATTGVESSLKAWRQAFIDTVLDGNVSDTQEMWYGHIAVHSLLRKHPKGSRGSSWKLGFFHDCLKAVADPCKITLMNAKGARGARRILAELPPLPQQLRRLSCWSK
jgi:hypothetical protein